jgi:hypothetical protein
MRNFESFHRGVETSGPFLGNLFTLRTIGAIRPMPREIHAENTLRRDCELQSTFMAMPTRGAPPIPLDEFWEGLAGNCLSERNLRCLREDQVLPELQYRADQIFHRSNWARTELGIGMIHSNGDSVVYITRFGVL